MNRRGFFGWLGALFVGGRAIEATAVEPTYQAIAAARGHDVESILRENWEWLRAASQQLRVVQVQVTWTQPFDSIKIDYETCSASED